MKAERRHELQTNSLARFLENLPLYFRFHFGKVLLGLLVFVLLIVLIRQRMTTGNVARQQTANALGDVRRLLNELQVVDLTRATPDQRAEDRKRFASQIDGAIDEIIANTDEGPDDAAMRAEALVARGDLNWIMANLPEVPGAATQPALGMPKAPEQYLADAAEAYEQVLRQYPDRPMSALTAEFGLASVAENQGKWDVARAHYETILRKPDAALAFREWAMARLNLLPSLQEPVFTGSFGTPPTTLPDAAAAPASATQPGSSTQPASTQPQ
jgi:tetratricopeptide (TPR) repeat protein